MSEVIEAPSVERVESLHALASTSAGSAVQYAIQCGQELLRIKAELAHGEFGKWCEGLTFSSETARRYMRVASMEPNRARVTDLSLRSLLSATARPRGKPAPTEAHMSQEQAEIATPSALVRRPREQRVAEIEELVRKGHNVEQIAEIQGLGLGQTRRIINDADIKIAIQKKGRKLDSNRILRESIATLRGVAQGLSLAGEFDIDASEAQSMRSDLALAMKSLRSLDSTLKEIANG
jgi:hypothetical protein